MLSAMMIDRGAHFGVERGHMNVDGRDEEELIC